MSDYIDISVDVVLESPSQDISSIYGFRQEYGSRNIGLREDIILSDNTLVDKKINELINLYCRMDFLTISPRLDSLIAKNTAFIIDKKHFGEILDKFRKVILVKHVIKRYKDRKNTVERDWVETNDRDLSLNFIDKSRDNFVFKNYENKTIQNFTCSEIVSIFRYSIFNNDLFYSYAQPESPRNPYTNISFSTRDLISMYMYLLKKFSRIGKCMPEYIVIFKNSYFDIDILHKRYHGYLSYYSAYEYIYNLSNEKWIRKLKYFISMYSQINKTSCIKCILNRPNFRDIFSKVLILSELNTHGSFEFGDSLILYNFLQRKHSLFFNSSHDKNHRRMLRGRRRHIRQPILSTIRVVEPIIPEPAFIINPENVPIAMTTANYHLVETVYNVITDITNDILSSL